VTRFGSALHRCLIACLLASATCRAPDETPPASAPPDGAPAPLGMPPLAGFFADKLAQPGPFEAPRESADFAADAPHLLVLELDRPIGEIESFSWTGGATTTMRSIGAQLQEAAKNEQVQGIVLRTSDLAIGFAHASELRAELIAFKDGGKRKLLCHTERIGEIAIPGPAATPIHVKGLLDKFGITADFMHVGAFKGAAEPLTRDAPSPEMLQTLEAIVERSYSTQKDALVSGRKLSAADAAARIDAALFVADKAVAAGLADEVATWEHFVAGTGLPWKQAKNAKVADFMALQRFIGLLPAERPSEPHVALVYAVGTIVDGSGTGILGAREQIASRTLVPALHALANDDNVRAVVLRVDSGGGSALASEQIWAAMAELGAKKPVVVSMGSVAASGGYYISAPAKTIFAQPDTLTGSIGVVGGKIVVRDALASIGVRTYDVHRGARARIWSSVSTWDETERAAVRELMEETYATFVDRVATGRRLAREQVLALAEGRVWTGTDAKERGLVDVLGGLDAALAEAASQAGLEPGGPLTVYPPEPTLRDILTSFGTVSTGPSLADAGSLAGPLARVVAEMSAIAVPDARFRAQVQRMLATIAALQGAHVWALSPSFALVSGPN
jgi:protease-4